MTGRYFVKKIWLDSLSEYSTQANNQSERQYINISRLNLFIGPNYSGKSRLLRKIFDSAENRFSFNASIARPKIDDIKKIGLLTHIEREASYHFISGHEIYKILHDDDLISYADYLSISKKLESLVQYLYNSNSNVMGGDGARNVNTLRNRLGTLSQSNIGNIGIAGDFIFSEKYYVPILRGMRPLDASKNDHYRNRTKQDYFKDSAADKNIITGLHLYDLLSSFLLGQPDQRSLIRQYEQLLSQEFFEGNETTLIPEYQKDTISIKIGDDPQYPIYNLGDGLQQVIIITSAAFLQSHPCFFIIEEPENGLHPGLLKKLAKFLITHTKHQYFISTHSNHLLELADSGESIKIHRIKKLKGESSNPFSIQECSNNKEILADLGVSPASVYLANCSIWVEGITDRLYIKAFLDKYISSQSGEMLEKYSRYIENYHYVFVEYQGGTLGHWRFTEDDISPEDHSLNAIKTCSDIFLIADGDITKKGNRAEILKSQLSDRLHIIPGKEIENILPEEILKPIALDRFNKMRKDKEDLDISRISTLSYKDYNDSLNGIGYHLDRKLGLKGKGKNARRIFADESGTILEKVKFCNQAVSFMKENEWELTPPIINICKEIISHIERNNHT